MSSSHWYQKVGSEPLLENDPESFVARIVILPPQAGFCASCQLQGTSSSALPEEDNSGDFSSLCVAGGTFLQLREHAMRHKPYGRSWINIIVYCFTTLLLTFVGHWKNQGSSDEEGSAITLLVAFPAAFVGSKVGDYVDQKSERHCTAIQSFCSDLQLQISQITETLQPFGYTVSMQEKNGDEIEVVIEKSLEWSNDNGLPGANTEENQAKLTEAGAEMIQRGWLSRDTPLDIWLFGGLMVCLQNVSKAHAKNSRRCKMFSQILVFACWTASLVAFFTMPFLRALPVVFFCFLASVFLWAAAVDYYKEYTDGPDLHAASKEIIDDLSPISDGRVGYTMNYVIEPGCFRGTTKGIIKFQETATKKGGKSDGLMAAQIA